jgi:hypothetical protein
MSVNGDTGNVGETVDPREIYRDTHLDADKALDCAVAMAYFIKAFGKLTTEERNTWVAAHNDEYRFELGSYGMSLGGSDDVVFFLSLTAADVTTEDLDTTFGTLNNSLEGTPFADETFRNSYTFHLAPELVEAQRQMRMEVDEDALSAEEVAFLLNLMASHGGAE